MNKAIYEDKNYPEFLPRIRSPRKISMAGFAFNKVKFLKLRHTIEILNVISNNEGISETGVMIELRRRYGILIAQPPLSSTLHAAIAYGYLKHEKVGNFARYEVNHLEIERVKALIKGI